MKWNKLSWALMVVVMVMARATVYAQASVANVVAARPPMGWNSWNHFGDKVTAADVRAAADALVTSGMRDAGYVYVNVDDGWQGTRDAAGRIHANVRFGDMKALVDYVHSRGLKFGIYSSPGPRTCAGYEGSFGHEVEDAQVYTSWGVDYLKYDLCTFGGIIGTYGPKAKEISYADALIQMRRAYEVMHRALMATGRPILYSFCQYGFGRSWQWAAADGANLWRTTGDIQDNYDRMINIGFSQDGLEKFAGPGHWNDPDMLEVGNGHMTHDEYLSHMSLWALLAAPLLAGNDLSTMSDATRAILTNREVIAIDQDEAGVQGHRAWSEGTLEVWVKPLADGSSAVGLFNEADWTASVDVDWERLGYSGPLNIRDVWSGTDLAAGSERLRRLIPRHGVLLLRVSRASKGS
ncbi:alpha-galactosidase [Bryocella elongata]|uniref:Alpha-galactosidase n=1 Tax=Bryocella elongata TaxID=863522 RepID=A0A1H5VRG9_9BACT|nr:glycoside hydrolase family 27 protein [Bryocella elongata]SEF89899.1 alpha-galactosidase [Bryocella elongata]